MISRFLPWFSSVEGLVVPNQISLLTFPKVHVAMWMHLIASWPSLNNLWGPIVLFPSFLAQKMEVTERLDGCPNRQTGRSYEETASSTNRSLSHLVFFYSCIYLQGSQDTNLQMMNRQMSLEPSDQWLANRLWSGFSHIYIYIVLYIYERRKSILIKNDGFERCISGFKHGYFSGSQPLATQRDSINSEKSSLRPYRPSISSYSLGSM